MTVCLDVACRTEEKMIYGISSIDNKVYACNLETGGSKIICNLPVIDDGWFSISYCNKCIFLTTNTAKKIYMIREKNKNIVCLDWKNPQKSAWGMFVVTLGEKVYFFDRNPFFLLIYDTKKKMFLNEKLIHEIMLDKVENISTYKNFVVLYNISESKIVIIDLLNNSIINEFDVNIKISLLKIISNQIFVISNFKMYVYDFYGTIIKIIEMPLAKQNQPFYFLDKSDKIAIYDCWGRQYIYEDKFKAGYNLDECLTPIASTGEQILKTNGKRYIGFMIKI